MRKNMGTLLNLLRAKDPLILVRTYEENAFIRELCMSVLKINGENKTYRMPASIYIYSTGRGMYKLDPMQPLKYDPKSVEKNVRNVMDALQFIENVQLNNAEASVNSLAQIAAGGEKSVSLEPAIFVMKDLHLYYTDKNVMRKLRDMKEQYGSEANYCPVIVTAPVATLPCELEKIFTLLDFPLLTKPEIIAQITPLVRTIYKDDPKVVVDEKLNSLADSLTGLTDREITRALSHSIAKNNKQSISTDDIFEEKLQAVKKSDVLEIIQPNHGMDDLGGCAGIKEWFESVKESMTPEAREFGVPAPKGAMLVGIPGTSKSVSAEILASHLQLPLISLNISACMGSLVGQSEQAIGNALRIIKAMAPVVLLCDEVDKTLGGAMSSAASDAGTLSRVLAQILTFLQEEDTGVICIFTSNNSEVLPMELTRSGRLDKNFAFFLPSPDERREIAKIYLDKNGLVAEKDVLEHIVEGSDHFTGAEIKSAVKEMLISAFVRQKKAGVSEFSKNLTVDDVDAGLTKTTILWRSSKEKVEAFCSFASSRFLDASKPAIVEQKPVAVKPLKRQKNVRPPIDLFSVPTD